MESATLNHDRTEHGMRAAPEVLSGFRLEAIIHSLHQSGVFAGLGERDLHELAESATLRILEKGELLFRMGESSPGLHVVARGIINLHRIADDGSEVVIRHFHEGEILWGFGIGDRGECPGHASAVVPAEVIVISKRGLLMKLRQCPDLVIRLLASIDTQLRQFADLLEDTISHNASRRFVQWLLRRCGAGFGSEPVAVRLTTTKRAVAGELRVRQETLSRTLRLLSDAGFIAVDGPVITVRDPGALRAAWADG